MLSIQQESSATSKAVSLNKDVDQEHPKITIEGTPESGFTRSGEPNMFDGAPASTAKQATNDLHINTGHEANPSENARSDCDMNDLQVS